MRNNTYRRPPWVFSMRLSLHNVQVREKKNHFKSNKYDITQMEILFLTSKWWRVDLGDQMTVTREVQIGEDKGKGPVQRQSRTIF